MLTTNHAYDIDFYRRSGPSMSYVLRNHQLAEGYGSPTYSSNRDTPVPDSEGKTAGTHRKRVPVACERCRKRKIKCSGDQGDGSGCDNCKNAGHDGCQFLRVLSRPLQQYSQSYSTPRYHSQHYHPYSRPSHVQQIQQNHQARECVQQPTSPYDIWQSSLEYSGIPAATSNNATWNPNNYTTAYQIYDAEHTSTYSSQPPSYMLPDPDHGARPEMSYLASLPRAHHHHLWLDSMHAGSFPHQHSQVVSPVYPLTPAESIKSHSVFKQPAIINTGSERTLSTATLATLQQASAPHGRETPPLSAASHRSSHTWPTDSTSNVSAVSSRTSCGGSQDLTAMANPYSACEDQAAVYPYEADDTNSLLNVAISSMPVTAEDNPHTSELQQAPQVTSNHGRELASLRARVSRDSLGSSSPSIYGQSIRSSTRRSHAMYPPRLMTSFHGSPYPPTWNPSLSSPPSRHDSAVSQAAIHPLSGSSDEYSDDHGQVSESLLDSHY